MSDDKQQAFIVRLAEVLETAPGELTPDYTLDDRNWDSLAHMATIAAIDEEYGITVPADVLTNCSTVGELLDLIRQQSGS